MSTSNAPPVGAEYRGGVVTARRKDTVTGVVELQVNGRWLVFDLQVKTAETSDQPYKDETNLKMAETSGLADIAPGDWVRYCGDVDWILRLWGREPWPVLRCVNGCLSLPHPDNPNDFEMTLSIGWERTEAPPKNNDSLSLPHPDRPGETVPVTPDNLQCSEAINWEVPA